MNDSYVLDAEWQSDADESDEPVGAPIEMRVVALVGLALIVLPFATAGSTRAASPAGGANRREIFFPLRRTGTRL